MPLRSLHGSLGFLDTAHDENPKIIRAISNPMINDIIDLRSLCGFGFVFMLFILSVFFYFVNDIEYASCQYASYVVDCFYNGRF